jgi:hypothetical protein
MEVLQDVNGKIITDCWKCNQGNKIGSSCGIAIKNPTNRDIRHIPTGKKKRRKANGLEF